MLEKNIVTKDQLQTKFIEYTESGDIDDIADECPVVLKFIEKVKSL